MNLQLVEQEARTLVARGQLGEAETQVRAALSSGSGPISLWRLLAQIVRPQGRIAEARTIQEMLVNAVPGDLSMRFDLSETLLLLGEFERGWREYQYRYSLSHTTRIDRKVQRPRWDGRAIPGKRLLVHDEQGFGDSFQFIRMVPWAKRCSGAHVVLEVNSEILPLAQRASLGFDEIVARGQIPPLFDLHCELMSLPMAVGLKLTDLPGAIPYLAPEPSRLAHWRQRLESLPRPRVALVWAGRPTHFNDANRSMSIDKLGPLAIPGVTYISIQKGPQENALDKLPMGLSLHSLSGEIRDFEDTAAILSVIDLLISVDSSPVHLAGALNRPAWVMLPFVPDWRWLLGRADTPWYPSVRLFRQDKPGDWPGVLDRVRDALAALKVSGPVPDNSGSK